MPRMPSQLRIPLRPSAWCYEHDEVSHVVLASALLDLQELATLLDSQPRGKSSRAHVKRALPANSARSRGDRSRRSPCGSLAAGGRAETLAAPTATRSDDLAAVAGRHAGSETVGAGPAEIVGLIGTLGHLETRSPNPAGRIQTHPGGEGAGSIAAAFDHVKPSTVTESSVPTTLVRILDSSFVVESMIRGSIDRKISGPRPTGGWHADNRAAYDDLARPETGMASQLARAWPRKLAALAGGFDRGSDGLWISRTISSRSNFAAARFNRVALATHLGDDQKIDENQRLVIIARLDPCPWGVGVSTNLAVAGAPSADHLDSQIRITLGAQTSFPLRLARLTDACHDPGLMASPVSDETWPVGRLELEFTVSTRLWTGLSCLKNCPKISVT
jgi:hypothetical protein